MRDNFKQAFELAVKNCLGDGFTDDCEECRRYFQKCLRLIEALLN